MISVQLERDQAYFYHRLLRVSPETLYIVVVQQHCSGLISLLLAQALPQGRTLARQELLRGLLILVEGQDDSECRAPSAASAGRLHSGPLAPLVGLRAGLAVETLGRTLYWTKCPRPGPGAPCPTRTYGKPNLG